jgi:hypothetical protein
LTEKESKVEQLSKLLAESLGLKLPRPPSPQGVLTNDKGKWLHWYKCPRHDKWLQPEWQPFDHWKCAVNGCNYIRNAKMRTRLERHIFRSAQRIDELG